MTAIILAALTVLLALLVVGQALTAAAALAAVATVEQLGRHADTTTADGDPLYEGRHCAPDPEATTAQLTLPALVRPYAAGGVR